MKQPNSFSDEKASLAYRYVHGKLCESELEEIETQLIANPNLLEEIELDSVFVNTLSHEPVTTAPTNLYWWEKLSRFFAIPALVNSAAMFAVGLLVAQMFTPNQPSLAPNTGVEGVSNVVYFDTLRSANTAEKTLVVSKNAKHAYVFFLQTGPNQHGPFEVSLWHNETNRAAFNLPIAPLSNTGEVIVSVLPEHFSNGSHTIHVTDISSQTKTQTSFTVVKE